MILSIYGIWGLLVWGIIILLLIIVMIPIYKSFKYARGKTRRITGEIFRDIGIGMLVGTAFKYNLSDLTYYVLLLISLLFIIWGVTMKEHKK
jgi:uncharacterized membrane protein